MDQEQFDRIARLLGGATSRRRGLSAALAGLAGLAGVAGSATAGRGNHGGGGKERGRDGNGDGNGGRRKPRPEPAGPCGNGTVKDNRCRKNSECCTNICKMKNKGKDGSGRCRCQRKHRPCTEDRNCCSAAGQQMACIAGHCGFPAPTPPAVPTGSACDPLSDICASAAASCVPYSAGNPTGTYCLLPNGTACAAAGDCASKDCAGGICAAEVCDVCASGCPYTTVAAAISAKSAGAVIRIDTGTYDEDLVFTKGLTLSNCNGSAVTLRNATSGSRTLDVDLSATPTQTLQIHNLTVTSSSGAGNVGGGIQCLGNLILSGSTNVTGCKAAAQGGGVMLGDFANPYLMSMFDSAAVTGNASAGYPHGGGVFVRWNSRLEMRGRSSLRNNTTVGYGGGVATENGGSVGMYDDAEITGNTADTYGGGVYLYGGAERANSFELLGNARIWDNHAQRGAGGVFFYTDGDIMVMADEASIDANTTASGYGGGIYFDNTGCVLLMSGNASITGNAAGTPAPTGGGIYKGKVFMYGSSSISGNTPDQCYESTGC